MIPLLKFIFFVGRTFAFSVPLTFESYIIETVYILLSATCNCELVHSKRCSFFSFLEDSLQCHTKTVCHHKTTVCRPQSSGLYVIHN